jgi:hypothetical protein
VSLTFRLGTIFMMAAALFVASLAPARAEILFNDEQSFDGVTFTHPITGELLTLSGSAHLLIGMTQTPNGAHSTVSINYQGVKAVGTVSGTEYTFVANDRDKANVADDIFPGVFSFVRTARLISQGAESNVIMRSTFRAVYNNNGTLVVERTRNEVLIVGDGDNDN